MDANSWQPTINPRRIVIWWLLGLAVLVLVGFGLTKCAAPSLPAPIGENCGAVQSHGGLYARDDNQAEQCLWQAYQRCQTASLRWDLILVDTGFHNLVTIQRQGATCAVTYYTQGYSANVPSPSTPLDTYSCGGLRQQSGGIVFTACGAAGDVTLAGRPPQQVGHVCAEFASYDAASYQIAGDTCLWDAYTSCTSGASLVYTAVTTPTTTPASSSSGYTTHTLVVQPKAGVCAVSDAAQPEATGAVTLPPYVVYPCAGLAHLGAGGLVADSCGKEGDVTVPPV